MVITSQYLTKYLFQDFTTTLCACKFIKTNDLGEVSCHQLGLSRMG